MREGPWRLARTHRRVDPALLEEAPGDLGHLRREVGDKLFVRTAAGLTFTPGGLRLAGAAAEILALQDRTRVEVSRASGGRRRPRMARMALSTL